MYRSFFISVSSAGHVVVGVARGHGRVRYSQARPEAASSSISFLQLAICFVVFHVTGSWVGATHACWTLTMHLLLTVFALPSLASRIPAFFYSNSNARHKEPPQTLEATMSWSSWCFAASSRSLQTLFDDVYGSGGLLIFSFLFCAGAQGVGFVRWRQLSDAQRIKEWSLYGTFAATSCLGCICGSLAYASRMFQLTFRYKADSLSRMQYRSLSEMQQLSELRADQRRFTAAFYALFPMELAFVSIAYIFVLHRMQCFALQKSKHRMRWIIAGRIFLGAVVFLNVVGVCGNIAAAVSYNRAADFSSFAARAYAVNDTIAGRNFENQAKGAGEVAAVQRFCEVSVLVMTTAAFIAVGVNNINIIYAALRDLLSAQEASMGSLSDDGARTFTSARHQGKKLLVRVAWTVLLVFATFLVRSIFTILYAVAQAFPDSQQENGCVSTDGCELCRGVYTHIQTFIIYEPAFQNIVILLASPMTLLVALWCMSPDSAAPETSDQL